MQVLLPFHLAFTSAMAEKYMQLVLTPSVQRAQEKFFGNHQAVQNAPDSDVLTEHEKEFILSRDSFYLGTISEDGWPYVQHRGGPVGFVKILRANLIGFADFHGNRQLVSTGNLEVCDRVAIFMMDYPRRRRLKMLGHARVLDGREHGDLVNELAPQELRDKVERVFLIEVVSYDWNCPKYITPRFTEVEIRQSFESTKIKLRQLEEENTRLRQKLASMSGE